MAILSQHNLLSMPIGGQRPLWPFGINRNSWQANGLVAWWPFPAFSTTGPAVDMGPSGRFNMANVGPTWIGDVEMGMVPDFSGSSQYFQIEEAVITGTPLTLSCWFNSDSLTTIQTLIQVADKSVGNQSFILWARGDVGGDPIEAVTYASSFKTARTSIAYTLNKWHLATAVFVSPTNRRAFIDGGNRGTESSSRTPTGLDRTSIGSARDSSPNWHLNGRIADARVYNRALSDDEVAALFYERWDLFRSIRTAIPLAGTSGVALIAQQSSINRFVDSRINSRVN